MKSIVPLLFVVTLLFTVDLSAQKMPDIDKSPMDMAYLKSSRNAPPVARVIYSRPQKKDRDVFGSIVPYEKVWRTGANEAAEITFYEDVTFGGKAVGAGTYALFTIPGEKEWTVILNSELHQWGAYGYDASKDVLRATATSKTTSETVEAFTIVFEPSGDGGKMHMAWDTTHVVVPLGK